jgi:hypothetical protein
MNIRNMISSKEIEVDCRKMLTNSPYGRLTVPARSPINQDNKAPKDIYFTSVNSGGNFFRTINAATIIVMIENN